MAENIKDIYGSVSIRYGLYENFTNNADKFFNYEFLIGFGKRTKDGNDEYDPSKWDLKLVVPTGIIDDTTKENQSQSKNYLTLLTDANIKKYILENIFVGMESNEDLKGEIILNTNVIGNKEEGLLIKTLFKYDIGSFLYGNDNTFKLIEFNDNAIDNNRYFYSAIADGKNCIVSYDKNGRITSVKQDDIENGRGNANKLHGRDADYYLNGSNIKRSVDSVALIDRNENTKNIIILSENTNDSIEITKKSNDTDDFYIINKSEKNIMVDDKYLLLNNSVYHIYIDSNNNIYVLGEYVGHKNLNSPKYINSEGKEISLRPYGISNISSNKIFDEQIISSDTYSFSLAIEEDCIANGEATINYMTNGNAYSANVCFALKKIDGVLSLIDYQLKTIFADNSDNSDIPIPVLKTEEGQFVVSINNLSSDNDSKISTVIDFKNITYI